MIDAAPSASHWFDLDGIRMHYVDTGAGAPGAPPVVMVHGNPTGAFYYRSLVEALAPGRRCIVPDHVGCGRSDKPTDTDYPYTLARRIDDLDALIEHLALGDAIDLVVHDWGGMIGTGWATRHAARVRRIVVLNTAAFRLPATKRMPWQLTACRMPGIGAVLVRGLNGFCRYAVRHCTTRPLDAETRARYLAPYDSWRNRIAVHRFVQDIPLKPSHPSWSVVETVERALPRLAAKPMLIAWGMRDFVFDRHFLDGWTERFPDADVHRFDDAGHYVLEDAGERIAPLVTAFLAAEETAA